MYSLNVFELFDKLSLFSLIQYKSINSFISFYYLLIQRIQYFIFQFIILNINLRFS